MKKLILAGFLLSCSTLGWANVIYSPTCSQPDIQLSINQAQNGDTVYVPAGSCTWTTSVSLDATKRSIALQGAGPDKTIITANTPNTLWITGADGYAFVVSSMAFVGGMTDVMVNVSGNSKSWRIHHMNFTPNGLPLRVFRVAGPTYGVIDHNTVTGVTPSEFATVEDASLAAGDGGWVSWRSFPVNMGDAYAVYIEDNYVSWTGNWQGRPFIDGEVAGRAVVRYNTVINSMFGNHGFDSGDGASMLRLEVYENTMTVTDSMSAWARLGLVRGGTGVWFNNKFIEGPNVWGSSSIALAIFRNTVPASWPVCDGTQFKWCSNIDQNWKLLDGTWAPKMATSDAGCVASVIRGDSSGKNYTAKWKMCSESRMNLCETDSDCPASETCGNYVDGPDANGYACFMQPGRGTQDQVMPLYEWNNTLTGTINLHTNNVDFNPEDPRIVAGRDFFKDTPMPGYQPYTYPHPLTVSGFTSDAGGPVINPPPPAVPTPTPTSGSAASTDPQFLVFKNVFNPIRETVTIRYANVGSDATLKIYDRWGTETKTLTAGVSGQSIWDGKNAQGQTVASGTYLAVLKQGGKIVKKKIVVVK